MSTTSQIERVVQVLAANDDFVPDDRARSYAEQLRDATSEEDIAGMTDDDIREDYAIFVAYGGFGS